MSKTILHGTAGGGVPPKRMVPSAHPEDWMRPVQKFRRPTSTGRIHRTLWNALADAMERSHNFYRPQLRLRPGDIENMEVIGGSYRFIEPAVESRARRPKAIPLSPGDFWNTTHTSGDQQMLLSVEGRIIRRGVDGYFKEHRHTACRLRIHLVVAVGSRRLRASGVLGHRSIQRIVGCWQSGLQISRQKH
ncbi:hypothetical protein EX30DRAFT_365340 [Ascodesmis nigricans]|uniref:Uncharacterized protein n=1 Tax=Ascodesmis nigricans TaxID=341454 RepID=A0A4S2MQ98_9PEZI|nr:hypothetical protein EX30DRAFT_365340 [Ascodesmis nigricans]